MNKLVLSSSLKISVAARLEQLRGLRADSVVLHQNKLLGLPAPDKFEEIHKDSENSFDKFSLRGEFSRESADFRYEKITNSRSRL